MPTTLEDIFSPNVLTEFMQSPEDGVPKIWPEKFYTTTKNIMADKAGWFQTAATRKNAKAVNYGSASRKRSKRGGTQKASQAVHFFEHITFEMDILERIGRMSDDADQAKIVREHVAGQIEDFRLLFWNSRTSAMSSMFANRKIWLDGNGDILPSTSGHVQEIDLGYHADDFNQLAGVIAASWATASTSILKHLQNWQAVCRKAGKPIEYMFYGSDILGYFLANTEIKELLKSDSGLSASLRQGRIPDNFGFDNANGKPVKWIPLQDAFFDDSTGTNQDWFTASQVVSAPEADISWYEFQEGSFSIPKSFEVMTDPNDIFKNTQSVNGMFSYAKVTDDPVSVKLNMGDTFLPVPKNNRLIKTATVAGF